MNLPYIKEYINSSTLPIYSVIEGMLPWEATASLDSIIQNLLNKIDDSQFKINDNQAIHNTATIEYNAQLKGPMIIGANCFVANGCLLRNGIILNENCSVGHCSEVKTSILFSNCRIAHFNFVGDSIVGNDVNIESGAVLANYRDELDDKEIYVTYKNQKIATNVQKFGAIVGDQSKIGANAVLAPGTILDKNSIVKRGESLDQI
ncbi:MAG: LpxA family transferase [Planctomycetota bacterium]|nr:MAG: LpxA family transferase [Planctomycetota bacterium]